MATLVNNDYSVASLIKIPRSPFWYIKFRDPLDGKWKRKATPFRWSVSTQTRKARDLMMEHSQREGQRIDGKEAWGKWVEAYLAGRSRSLLTIERSRNAWCSVEKFLAEKKITHPRLLTFEHCREYMTWRVGQNLRRCKKPISYNTALIEIRTLGVVMREAVRLNFAPSNPCREMGLRQTPPREKPALTDEQIIVIREQLRSEPAWMTHAFEIAIHHGCRINELRVPICDVDLARAHIHFSKTKGNKPFTVPIHPAIMDLVKRRVNEGAGWLVDLPPNASRLFCRFFKRIGLPGISFHCTRVTVATQLARAGVSMPKAMRYLNHASALVHRTYQRLTADDLDEALAAVMSAPCRPENPDSPRST